MDSKVPFLGADVCFLGSEGKSPKIAGVRYDLQSASPRVVRHWKTTSLEIQLSLLPCSIWSTTCRKEHLIIISG